MERDILLFVSDQGQYFLFEETQGNEIVCSDSDGGTHYFTQDQIDFAECDGERFSQLNPLFA